MSIDTPLRDDLRLATEQRQHQPQSPEIPGTPETPVLTPELSDRAQRYQNFERRLSTSPSSDTSALQARLGDLSPEDSYLFQETPIAKSYAQKFMQHFLSHKDAEKVCTNVFKSKLAYLAEQGQVVNEKDEKSKCMGFTTFAQQRGDAVHTFCIVSLSGVIPEQGTEHDLSDLLSRVTDELNENPVKEVTYLYEDNPSDEFRRLFTFDKDADQKLAHDWERPCAEFSSVKTLMEVVASPKYNGNIKIKGGLFLFLPKPDEFGVPEVKIKAGDARRKGYFPIEAKAVRMQFKGRPVPCCSTCQARKPDYLRLLFAADSHGVESQSSSGGSTPTMAPSSPRGSSQPSSPPSSPHGSGELLHELSTPESGHTESRINPLFTHECDLTAKRDGRRRPFEGDVPILDWSLAEEGGLASASSDVEPDPEHDTAESSADLTSKAEQTPEPVAVEGLPMLRKALGDITNLTTVGLFARCGKDPLEPAVLVDPLKLGN